MIRVFVAEDEPLILRDISALIPQVNTNFYIAQSCTNGKQVISELRREIPDVLITDIQMPVITGLELIEHIVAEKLPIICIILTSYKEFEYAKQAVDLNVFRYLLKPVDEDELAAVLTALEQEVDSPEYKNRRREYFSLQSCECENANKKLVYDMETYILEHLHENINQQVLSEVFKYGAPYISRIFKKYKMLSPTQFITQVRVEKVKALLDKNPSVSVKSIAALVGIEDPLYLSKIFKKETGISISRYKEMTEKG